MSSKAQIIDFLLAGVRDPDTDLPLNAGTVTVTVAGTSNIAYVWDDRDKTLPTVTGRSTVTLEADGTAEVYGDGVYKFVIKDSAGSEISTSPIDFAEYSSLQAALLNGQVLGYTELKAVDTTSVANGELLLVSYRSVIGDDGGGAFYWIPTASLTSTDIANIAIDTLEGIYVESTGGYWKRGYDGNVKFDWFGSEKAIPADYDTFINGSSATFGAIPSISSTNRDTYTVLLAAGYAVDFGEGIYPFDAAVPAANTFIIRGAGKLKTLIWCPNSDFLTFSTAIGATYPSISDIRIECNDSVVLTKAHLVNAIQGLVLERAFFISYASHAFWNDATVPGGTGCPIYGSKITEVGVYCGPAKGGFTGWLSASNVYDNVVDANLFFNNQATNKKGIARAIFYNSNVRDFCNSNISYSGIDYVYFADQPSSLFTFNAHHNVFETNSFSFKAIVKCDAASSNLYLDTYSNRYIGVTVTAGDFITGILYTIASIGTTDFTLIGASANVVGLSFISTGVGSGTGTASSSGMTELGYHYILLLGNTYLVNTDSPTPLHGDTVRNLSDKFVMVITTKLDSGATKYRLKYYEPHSSKDEVTHNAEKIITPSLDLAALMGMSEYLIADSENISWLSIYKTLFSVNGDTFPGQYSGTTAARPTTQIYVGRSYFDINLGLQVWAKTIVHTLVSAGAFVTDTQYTITSVGSTDFTLIGAPENTVGIIFTATGAGAGTGTASETDTDPVVTWVNGAGATV